MNKLIDALDWLKENGQTYYTSGAELLADNNGTLFEKEFEESLGLQGFIRIQDLHHIGITKKEFQKMVYDIDNLDTWLLMEEKVRQYYAHRSIYIPQPAGGGHEPDFMVYHGGRMFLLEFKKMTNSNEPKYGDNGCHPFLIYVFKKVNKKTDTCIHTYYYGGDIIPIERYKKIQRERFNAQTQIKSILSEKKYNYQTPRISVGAPRVAITGPRAKEDVREQRESTVHDIILGKKSPIGIKKATVGIRA